MDIKYNESELKEYRRLGQAINKTTWMNVGVSAFFLAFVVLGFTLIFHWKKAIPGVIVTAFALMLFGISCISLGYAMILNTKANTKQFTVKRKHIKTISDKDKKIEDNDSLFTITTDEDEEVLFVNIIDSVIPNPGDEIDVSYNKKGNPIMAYPPIDIIQTPGGGTDETN